MGQDVEQIVVGANGKVWSSPVGTAAPATSVAVPGAGWVDLGYISEDGATVKDAKTLEVIPVWQLFYPARRIVTARDLTVAFVLRQWSKDTVKLAFGGGTITAPSAGNFKYVPPAPESIDERSLMIDWEDGVKNYRLILVRGMVTDDVETNVVRTKASDLPITFGVNGDDTGDPWYFLSNDAALDPA